jgi:hypothetical protein
MITVDCSSVIKALAVLWMLLPLLTALFVPRLLSRGTYNLVPRLTRSDHKALALRIEV